MVDKKNMFVDFAKIYDVKPIKNVKAKKYKCTNFLFFSNSPPKNAPNKYPNPLDVKEIEKSVSILFIDVARKGMAGPNPAIIAPNNAKAIS